MIISIIIPTYNEEEYLPVLLDSIKKQSYTDYEIIVADANSTDRTREIAEEYGCVGVQKSQKENTSYFWIPIWSSQMIIFVTFYMNSEWNDSELPLPKCFLCQIRWKIRYSTISQIIS